MSPYGFKCFLVCIKLVLLRSLYLFSQQNFPITFSVSFSVLFFFSSHICIFKVHSCSSYLNPRQNGGYSRISTSYMISYLAPQTFFFQYFWLSSSFPYSPHPPPQSSCLFSWLFSPTLPIKLPFRHYYVIPGAAVLK